MMTSRNDDMPYHVFHTRQQVDGKWKWVLLDTREVFSGKRVIMFGVPGAFTPTCSSKHLPRYEELYDEILAEGIDEVYCISVNDSFVMNAWFKQLGIEKVKALPDGDARDYDHGLTGKIWAGSSMKFNGFGYRSNRYALVIDNGIVEQVFEEDKVTQFEDPFTCSDADTVLQYLRDKKNGNLPKEPERPNCRAGLESLAYGVEGSDKPYTSDSSS